MLSGTLRLRPRLLAILITLVYGRVVQDLGRIRAREYAANVRFLGRFHANFPVDRPLGFMLFRNWREALFRRQSDRRLALKTKLVLGALALSLLPVASWFPSAYGVLNRTSRNGLPAREESRSASSIPPSRWATRCKNRAQALATGSPSSRRRIRRVGFFQALRGNASRTTYRIGCGVRTVCDTQEEPSACSRPASCRKMGRGGTLVSRLHPLIDLDKKQAEITATFAPTTNSPPTKRTFRRCTCCSFFSSRCSFFSSPPGSP